ncbi:hypothetical protein [Streptomyces sp. AC495_CC817]|uniref:hypothetical protein n=1 Tax=Streptomyces sp. AC495_CC817 TaxID=2823900 RepID=UPI001C26D142|nr:hypothetical protein [Streptomyces sp. AC495_CC817]
MPTPDAPLGIVLHEREPHRVAGMEREAHVIGSIHDGELLVVEFADDGTTAVLDVDTGEVSALNRDRAATEAFLAAFEEYLRAGPRPQGPVVMTAAQAAERLAAFREGRIVPTPTSPAETPHPRRLKTLRRRVRAADAAAVSDPASWWSGPLEQAGDDLL